MIFFFLLHSPKALVWVGLDAVRGKGKVKVARSKLVWIAGGGGDLLSLLWTNALLDKCLAKDSSRNMRVLCSSLAGRREGRGKRERERGKHHIILQPCGTTRSLTKHSLETCPVWFSKWNRLPPRWAYYFCRYFAARIICFKRLMEFVFFCLFFWICDELPTLCLK